jgi:hypothetical protein
MLSYKHHARRAGFSKELRSLNEFLKEVGGEIRSAILRSRDGTKDECTKEFTDTLIKMLAGYEWIHQIWIVGEDRPRMVNFGNLDLVLNPNLDGKGEEDETGIGPFGILISAKEKGGIFGPASSIRFTIFIVIAMINSFYVAENEKLYFYKSQESKGDLFFIKEIKKIPPGNQITTGGYPPFAFVKTIPDEEIKQKCSTLLNMPSMDNGLVSNLFRFLNSGGALIYADYPGTILDGSRLLVGELGPIAHLVSCAFGECRAAGGQKLISLWPIDKHQRVSSFIYTSNLKQQIDDLAYMWPSQSDLKSPEI